MPLSLSVLLPFHWLVAFCLFAAMCASGSDGFAAFIGLVDSSSAARFAGDSNLSLLFGIAFTLAAVLFLWCIVTAFTSNAALPNEYESVAGRAFGVAIAVVTALFIVSISRNAHFLIASSAMTAGLAASYAAIMGERRARALAAVGATDDLHAVIKRVALGAAHDSLLSKLTGRGRHRGEEEAT